MNTLLICRCCALPSRLCTLAYAQVNQIVQDLEWESGDLDVAYYSDGDGDGDGNRLPAGLVALEAFPDPAIHDHIVPMFSGAVFESHFYVWLKVRATCRRAFSA